MIFYHPCTSMNGVRVGGEKVGRGCYSRHFLLKFSIVKMGMNVTSIRTVIAIQSCYCNALYLVKCLIKSGWQKNAATILRRTFSESEICTRHSNNSLSKLFFNKKFPNPVIWILSSINHISYGFRSKYLVTLYSITINTAQTPINNFAEPFWNRTFIRSMRTHYRNHIFCWERKNDSTYLKSSQVKRFVN